ncbi:hypothetical protein NNO04_21645 [Citrobacter sp. Awk 4]|uniref:phage tail fiber protein n=1 Tax=Citrobacter sp. Awk 4 TaxID=2963955 RepID=UPI00230363BE|nr:hypothetical protein [Citrobacter sp. Awk 4]MDA8481264.1 hypothetical protein [Citrobacter sp. Awk 4]
MQVGAFGLGTQSTQSFDRDKGGFSWASMGNSINPEPVFGYGHIHNAISPTYNVGIAIRYAAFPRVFFQSTQGTTKSWTEAYTTGNTTKASDGTLKVASPVVKIFSDGHYQLNAESAGCTVTRLGIGEYLIEGCIGLNSDAAWGGIDGGFDIPTDRNKQPLLWLDYKVNANGSVLVKTYHRTYPDSPAFAHNEIAGLADGDPVDIMADQFVSVRVEMPTDSKWNQTQAEVIRSFSD